VLRGSPCEQAHRPVDAHCPYRLRKWFCRKIKSFDGRNLPLSERGDLFQWTVRTMSYIAGKWGKSEASGVATA
jgi:hypothetical protein